MGLQVDVASIRCVRNDENRNDENKLAKMHWAKSNEVFLAATRGSILPKGSSGTNRAERPNKILTGWFFRRPAQ